MLTQNTAPLLALVISGLVASVSGHFEQHAERGAFAEKHEDHHEPHHGARIEAHVGGHIEARIGSQIEGRVDDHVTAHIDSHHKDPHHEAQHHMPGSGHQPHDTKILYSNHESHAHGGGHHPHDTESVFSRQESHDYGREYHSGHHPVGVSVEFIGGKHHEYDDVPHPYQKRVHFAPELDRDYERHAILHSSHEYDRYGKPYKYVVHEDGHAPVLTIASHSNKVKVYADGPYEGTRYGHGEYKHHLGEDYRAYRDHQGPAYYREGPHLEVDLYARYGKDGSVERREPVIHERRSHGDPHFEIRGELRGETRHLGETRHHGDHVAPKYYPNRVIPKDHRGPSNSMLVSVGAGEHRRHDGGHLDSHYSGRIGASIDAHADSHHEAGEKKKGTFDVFGNWFKRGPNINVSQETKLDGKLKKHKRFRRKEKKTDKKKIKKKEEEEEDYE